MKRLGLTFGIFFGGLLVATPIVALADVLEAVAGTGVALAVFGTIAIVLCWIATGN